MRLRLILIGLSYILAACVDGSSSAHSPPKPKGVVIPKAFQGEWIADRKWCPPDIVDQWISANRMRFDHFVGDAKAVKVHGPRHITVTADLLSDGDPFEGDIDMKLSKSGDELKLNFGSGETSRYRCTR